MTTLEEIRFTLPVGTHIDRNSRQELGVLAVQDSYISTKLAFYGLNDILDTTGWPPNTSWKLSGGPRFITFTIPDNKWKSVNCNWGRIILRTRDNTPIGDSTSTPIESSMIRNKIWECLWAYCHNPHNVLQIGKRIIWPLG